MVPRPCPPTLQTKPNSHTSQFPLLKTDIGNNHTPRPVTDTSERQALVSPEEDLTRPLPCLSTPTPSILPCARGRLLGLLRAKRFTKAHSVLTTSSRLQRNNTSSSPDQASFASWSRLVQPKDPVYSTDTTSKWT